MALRTIFGEQCWQPSGHYANLIIDDPLLRPKYGHLDFKVLLELMEKHNFSTTIAFVPRNYRRSLPQTVQMFRQHSDRLSICFHGNDHTLGEFASTDITRLNTAVSIAEFRMGLHTKSSSVPCVKVMVFPHEQFSEQAMRVLKACNFRAVVNSEASPQGPDITFTLAEIAQPANLRHGGLPLYYRRKPGQIKQQDLAFALFFGRPAFIFEHHEMFKRPEALIETVLMINSMAPGIRWTNLAVATANTNLRRRISEDTYRVRAYSTTAQVENNEDRSRRFIVEWNHPAGSPPVGKILRDGAIQLPFEVVDSTILVSTEITAHSSHMYSVFYRNEYPSLRGLGLAHNIKALVRRRLSEARDNYAIH
jgi:hypothetical protein